MVVWGLKRALTRLAVACCAAALAAAASANAVNFNGQAASDEARQMAQWALDSADAAGRPFAVVDKKQARLFIFDANGQLIGAAPALLGLAKGDRGAPGIGNIPVSSIPPELRTTPAGRYESIPGRNLKGEEIVWIDYEAALAIHRLRPAPMAERRPERLASESPNDKRISFGCVVVSPEFFDQVVQPSLGRQRGVVYVLPEESGGGPLAGVAGLMRSTKNP
jgi:hypothetical protein